MKRNAEDNGIQLEFLILKDAAGPYFKPTPVRPAELKTAEDVTNERKEEIFDDSTAT